jgi:hypothetical protein
MTLGSIDFVIKDFAVILYSSSSSSYKNFILGYDSMTGCKAHISVEGFLCLRV